MLLIAVCVTFAQGNMVLAAFIFAMVICAILFLLGGCLFMRFAESCGERISVANQIAQVSPSGQWLPVLFGSYLIPIIGLLVASIDFCWIIALVFAVMVIALVSRNIPPAAFLLCIGYHFYEISFVNGAGGYNLISKRKTIDNPKIITRVIRLFENDYWLLEKGL